MILRYLCILLLMLASISGGYSQCTLTCNDKINIGLDVDCAVYITLDMIYEGTPGAGCNFTYEVQGVPGNYITTPGTYFFHIYDDTGAYCTGEILAEDKIPPVLFCSCESIYMPVDEFQATLNFMNPTWERPMNSDPLNCGSGEIVPYEVFEFELDINGAANFQNGLFNLDQENAFLALYEDCFDPYNPCVNLLGVDDNLSGSTVINIVVERGTKYFLVLSTLDSEDTAFGSYDIDISVTQGDIIIKNPDCVFSCADLRDETLINNQLPAIQEPFDNCGEVLMLEPVIEILDAYDACGSKMVRRTLAWRYNLSGYQQTTYCVEEYLFEAIQLNGAGYTLAGKWEEHPYPDTHDYYFPQNEIYLPCGSAASPEYIASYYDQDTPGTAIGKENDDYYESPFTIENNEGYPYAGPYYVTVGFDGNYHAQPIDNNLCNLYIAYTDQLYDVCGSGCYGNSKVVRTWNLIDWCKGNNDYYEQLIRITDVEGPTIEVSDITVSVDPWTCTANVPMPSPDHFHDGCDNTINYWVEPPLGMVVAGDIALQVPSGIYTFLYVGEDCCGNISTTPMNVTVKDITPPTAITIENLVIQLTIDIFGFGFTKLYAEDVDNYSTDGCGDVHIEIRRTDVYGEWCEMGNTTYNNNGDPDDNEFDFDNGAYVKFCCDDLNQMDDDGNLYGIFDVMIRVWDDGDANGVYGTSGDNYNEAWSSVRVEDKYGIQVDCPDHIELYCDQDFNDYNVAGEAIANGACMDVYCEQPVDKYVKKSANSAPFIGEEIPAYVPSCREGAIQRTWKCGNRECLQWIIMRPSQEDPISIIWPEDINIDCLGEVYEEPILEDRLCEQVGISLQSDTFYFEGGACYKILNNWSVINWCRYDAEDPDNNSIPEPGYDDGFVEGVYTHIQVVKLFDSNKPSLMVADTCIATGADCTSDAITLSAYGEDDGACGSDWLKWEVDIDEGSDWNVEYTYSSYLPVDDPYYLAPSPSGTRAVDILEGIQGNCQTAHRILWKVTDGCGNTESKTQFLSLADKKNPTPYFLNLSSAVMENGRVELWAKDFDAGSFDNCTDIGYLRYTFSETLPYQLENPNEEDPWYDQNGPASLQDYLKGEAESWDGAIGSSSMIFDCDAIEAAASTGGLIELTLYVWDECGNKDFAQVNLRLIDNEQACGSTNRAMVAGQVETPKGEGISGLIMNMMTDLPGYPVESMTDDSGLFSFPQNPINLDYQLTGKKNDDWLNGVSTLDLVLIQKHILQLKEIEDPYLMIAADINNDQKISSIDLIQLRKLVLGIIPNIPNNNSWRVIPKNFQMDTNTPWPFSENIEITSLALDEIEQDFVGVKVGDINESAVPNVQSLLVQNRQAKQIDLEWEFEKIGDLDQISFYMTDLNQIEGFQFALSGISTELLNVKSEKINIGSEHVRQTGNEIFVSWNKVGNGNPDDLSTPIFSLNFPHLPKGTEKELNLISSNFKAEAYFGSTLEIVDLRLLKRAESNGILFQNSPNPWKQQSSFGFSLKKDSKIELTFHAVSGELVYSLKGEFEAGTHQILLNKEDLKSYSGILFYTLNDGENLETKSMIILK